VDYEKKILIGGKALNVYGSNRLTDDTDYLVFVKDNKKPFLKDQNKNIDYINGNGSNFFHEIYDIEKDNQIASPQSLLELKAYGYIQHRLNGNTKKAIEYEFDMKYLALEFDLDSVTIAKKYLSKPELEEVEAIIKSVKK
jgi:hypothetical protein